MKSDQGQMPFRRVRAVKRPADEYVFEERHQPKKRKTRGRATSGAAEGPAPPIRRDRVQNAADRFTSEHQEKYEVHAKRSEDRLEHVQRHCETCPRLREQIDRRRSDGRVTMPCKTNRYHPSDLCRACRHLTAREALQCHVTAKAGPRRGVRKPKRKGPLKRFKRRPKFKRNVLTVYRKQSYSSHSDSDSVLTDVSGPRQGAEGPVEVRFVNSDLSVAKGEGSREAVVSRVESNNSVTSYHSYGSMSQPPQV